MSSNRTNCDLHVAAYYFPNYHVDPRNERWHGTGWTEWELMKRAESRFPGHQQPRIPVWGYEDEADPEVMARKIDVAADHGLTAFLFDWYWYSKSPFLQRPLEQAFMPARNAERLDFAIMWANHDWVNIHPWKRSTEATLLEPGGVDAADFEVATDYVIERYFTHPSYLTIDDRPYFSIYDLNTLIKGLGGLDQTADALQGMRDRAERAGFSGIHLNVVGWQYPVLPNEEPVDLDTTVTRLGFDSVTSYVWVHHHRMPSFLTPYADMLEAAEQGWHDFSKQFSVPYFPNVTVGWDPSPRTVASDMYEPSAGYPASNMISENTPKMFGTALERARQFLDSSELSTKLLTINAWNEWTEGSYLEPDNINGMGYLEQIRRVFGAG